VHRLIISKFQTLVKISLTKNELFAPFSFKNAINTTSFSHAAFETFNSITKLWLGSKTLHLNTVS
jgi:hypothetical protein